LILKDIFCMAMARKALVSGFDAFGGDTINPSYEAVRCLPRRMGKLNVVTAVLPTSFARAAPKLRALIKREQPDIVLCVGLAADRDALSIERIAVNLCDARIADNDGKRPIDILVNARGPVAYFSTLPVNQIVKGLMRAGLRAAPSMSAGTFVCNHVFYSLMHEAARRRKGPRILRAGFVHVPALPADNPQPALKDLVRGLQIVLRTTQRSISAT
jgi:pyroglutamyl-peptidase